jgi:GH35 family endo-1,4-beta-xylanase
VRTFQRPACLLALLVSWGSSALRAAEPAPEGGLRSAARSLFEIGVGIHDRIADRPADHRLLLSQFGTVTAENCMKPAQVQPLEGQRSFAQADRFVEFAGAKGLKVAGHCLVWAKDDRTPPWFFRDGER